MSAPLALLDPYVVCDLDLRLVFMNQPAERLRGVAGPVGAGEYVGATLPWLTDVQFDLEAIAALDGDATKVICATRFEHRVSREGSRIGILSIARPPAHSDPPEQARREVEERFQLAQQVAGLAVWDRSLETDVISWSREMFQLLDMEPGQIVPTMDFWRAHIHPDDKVRVLEEADETIAACGNRETEFRVISDTGRVKTVLSRWKVFTRTDGSPIRMVGVNLDITHRRELDRRLREINEQFAAIIEASPAPIVALMPTGEVTLWNPAAERLFGWAADEVLGKPLPFIPKEKQAEHAELRKRDLAGNTLASMMLRRVRKDGSPVDIAVSTATLRDHLGKITGIMSLYEDVTERLAAERALRESEERFRTLVEALPQLVWTTRPDGHCDYLSRQWCEFTGVQTDEHLGSGWLNAVHPDDRARTAETFATVVANEGTYDIEYRLRRYDGHYRWFKTRGLPVHDAEGMLTKYLGTCTDIEDQRTMMDALLRANMDLQQFAYAAAHDLQEPLRNVALYSQMLQRKHKAALNPEGQICVQHALDGAMRMQALIEDLLTYTQAASVGDVPFDLVDCNEVVAAVADNLNERMRECGAQLELSTLPLVSAHRTRMIQLFQNLISNALKYRQGDVPPMIRVQCRFDGTHWCFEVQDNGQGVKPEYQERIFGVFRRLHGREVPGTGIGLAICKRIVEQYGGAIGVRSEGSGKGSTFWFTLPVSDSE